MDIAEAERQVAAILQQLEADNDVVVKSIDLSTIEITAVGDSRRELQQRVIIEIERLPGNNWAT
ncbi:MAG TPA: hypothetical protein VFM75_11380 [Modicisalibacter sp.]|nr:hypothetical protein [Modicisalibacter sp.]